MRCQDAVQLFLATWASVSSILGQLEDFENEFPALELECWVPACLPKSRPPALQCGYHQHLTRQWHKVRSSFAPPNPAYTASAHMSSTASQSCGQGTPSLCHDLQWVIVRLHQQELQVSAQMAERHPLYKGILGDTDELRSAALALLHSQTSSAISDRMTLHSGNLRWNCRQ